MLCLGKTFLARNLLQELFTATQNYRTCIQEIKLISLRY